ncbi:MAG: hypothetical protein JRH19_09480 [Deltaproteobacteria bacterium]|nr:hypothetical protein [Deltaproteobacteria bacterium]
MADPNTTHTRADFVFDAFFCAGVGGSIVAIFFLIVDTLNGQAFFTPTLMGSVLLQGAAADAVIEPDLEIVAYYSIAHFVAFGLLGAAISFLVHELELYSSHPAILLLTIFVIFEVGFFLSCVIFMPGVLVRLGFAQVAVANLLCAAGIALWLVYSHRPDTWREWRHAAHLG